MLSNNQKDLTEENFKRFLQSFHLEGSSKSELDNYLNEDFMRFFKTFHLVPQNSGDILEIGSNPYFTTMLLKNFTEYNVTCTNYFDGWPRTAEQKIIFDDGRVETIPFININIEKDELDNDKKYDVILFCEVIEHLTNDPISALRNIKSALKPGAHLILTTPNVNRLENIARMVSGANIYDPYSGYGPYGRHNREYNKHELYHLLSHLGFEIETIFSADVHENRSHHFFEVKTLQKLIKKIPNREYDLGQYIFIRAKNTNEINEKKPSWLYRSYSPEEMCD